MTSGQTDTLVMNPALSGVILELHEGATLVPVGEFQRWALRQLRPLFGASRWTWGVGSEANDLVHAGLSVMDPDTRAGAATLTGCSLRSLLSPDALATPGVAQLVDGESEPEQAAQPSVRLAICMRESLPGLHAFLVCTRRARQGGFSRAERALLEVLAPHLFTAWRHARLTALHAQLARSRAQSAAIVDCRGAVHVADGPFFSLLRSAWPQWSGTRLPQPIVSLLSLPGEQVVNGVRWSACMLAGHDAILLSGTPAGALQRLTPGEARVAARILVGESYEQAAESLGISVNTLRNTLVRAYRRLGVRNKVELLRRLEVA